MTPKVFSKDSSPVHQPPPTLMQLFPRALVWGLAVAFITSGLFALWQMAIYFRQPGNTDFSGEFLPSLFVSTGQLFVILFLFFFLLRWIFLHRMLADRSFTVVGFLATFFGLAMLVVFFSSLLWSTYQWFVYTPRAIEQYNEKLRTEIAEAKDTETFINTRLKKVIAEKEREIASAKSVKKKTELRQLYDEEIIPYKRDELKKHAQEVLTQNPKFIREDTSPLAILVHFITAGPSGNPQNAGIWFALLGSLWIAVITIMFAVPVGVGAALYLEEYSSQRRSWLTQLIRININNLAGVPSVVYGVLGAGVFVYMFFQPLHRANPGIDARNILGGGLTLGLLTLPIIIVSAQEAIRAVPKSIREGAYALGATQWQVISRNVLPMASPGILTGTILAVSRAIGEAAPLVLFGALLFVDQEPGLFTRFTVMPMQIFAWADRPYETVYGEAVPLWQYNSAVASLLLIIALLGLNAIAIILRNRWQRQMRY